MQCDGCGTPLSERTLVLRHRQVIPGSRRVVEWTECSGCHVKAEARAERLKQEGEQERRIRLPEAPAQRARRPSNSLPFISQLDGADE